jgi:hypothetical protein
MKTEKKFKIENKFKKSFSKLTDKSQLRFIKLSLKVLNKEQLENVIYICINNKIPEEQQTIKEIIIAIKKIYNKKNWKFDYEV